MAEPRNHSVVPAGMLDTLTADPDKAHLYRHDTYAREGLALFAGLDAWDLLQDVTYVVLKPDAVAGRRCALLLDTLEAEGWTPFAASQVQFDPLLTREIWRYQFNAASDQRIAVVDHLLASGPSLLVLLKDTRRGTVPAAERLPASVRLTAAKGAADPQAARAGDLRSRIGRVNGLFNFMHTADDPADVVRELRLMTYATGTSWLREALLRLASGGTPEAGEVRAGLASLEQRIPCHDLDLTASLRRLAVQGGVWGKLAAQAASPACVGHWLQALGAHPLPPGPARWDVLTVVTGWIECNAPGVSPILATAAPAQWLRDRTTDDGPRQPLARPTETEVPAA